jgi:hypothetical protein
MNATSMTALNLLDALVRIDSVNPGLDPAGAGETQIAAYIARWGRSVGLSVEVLEGTWLPPSSPAETRRSPGSTVRSSWLPSPMRNSPASASRRRSRNSPRPASTAQW